MEVIYRNKELRLPDFLIIGAARSGTSSLYFYLREHPEIFMPAFKEPHFFSFFEKSSPHPNLPPWSVESYVKLFEEAKKELLIGEASASYLYYYEESIKNIKSLYQEQCGDLKLIMILRNPIERAWSYYLLLKRGGYEKDFFEAVEEFVNGKQARHFHNFLLSGMYYEQVQAYLDNFPFVEILLFEEILQNTANVLKTLYELLDLRDREYLPKSKDTAFNISGEPRHRILSPVYNILFRDNRLKDIFKSAVPYDVRQSVKASIGRRIVKRADIPDKVKSYLSDIFEPNLRSLLEVFRGTTKEAVVRKWLEK